MVAGDSRQEGAGLARLAGETRGEKHRLVAQLPAGGRRSAAQLAHAAGDEGRDVGQFLGGFLSQQAARGIGQAQAVAVRNFQCLRAGGSVRIRRTGGDHVQRVADDVAEDHGVDMRGHAPQRKAPALDGGETLTQRVDLHDVGAAGQQLARDIGQLAGGDEGLLKERRAAAGEQKQHAVVLRQARNRLQRAGSGAVAVFVRHGMARFVDFQISQRAARMVVLGHNHARVDALAQTLVSGAGHFPGRLARRHQNQPPAGLKGDLVECLSHGRARKRLTQRGVENAFCVLVHMGWPPFAETECGPRRGTAARRGCRLRRWRRRSAR